MSKKKAKTKGPSAMAQAKKKPVKKKQSAVLGSAPPSLCWFDNEADPPGVKISINVTPITKPNHTTTLFVKYVPGSPQNGVMHSDDPPTLDYDPNDPANPDKFQLIPRDINDDFRHTSHVIEGFCPCKSTEEGCADSEDRFRATVFIYHRNECVTAVKFTLEVQYIDVLCKDIGNCV